MTSRGIEFCSPAIRCCPRIIAVSKKTTKSTLDTYIDKRPFETSVALRALQMNDPKTSGVLILVFFYTFWANFVTVGTILPHILANCPTVSFP